MFKVTPDSLQTFIDTPHCVLEDRVQYSTVHIPNVFCDGHLQIINCVGIARQLHRDFLITLYKMWQTDMKKKVLDKLLIQKFMHKTSAYFVFLHRRACTINFSVN